MLARRDRLITPSCGGVGKVGVGDARTAARPPRGWSRADRPVSGLSSWVVSPAWIPFPRPMLAQWVPCDRPIQALSTTVAGAAPEFAPASRSPGLVSGITFRSRDVRQRCRAVSRNRVVSLRAAPATRCIVTTWLRSGNAGPGDGSIGISGDGARGRHRGCGCRPALLPAQCRGTPQARQVAGHRGRRRNGTGDPRASRRTLPDARLLRRGDRHVRRSMPNTSGSSIPSMARSLSCASTRCSRRRSR